MAKSIELYDTWVLVRTLEDLDVGEKQRLEGLIERASPDDTDTDASIEAYESMLEAADLVTFDSVDTDLLNDMMADDVARIVQTSLYDGEDS